MSFASFAEIEPGILARITTLEARERDLSTPPALAGIITPGKDVARRWKAAEMPARREVARMLCSPANLGTLRLGRSPIPGHTGSPRNGSPGTSKRKSVPGRLSLRPGTFAVSPSGHPRGLTARGVIDHANPLRQPPALAPHVGPVTAAAAVHGGGHLVGETLRQELPELPRTCRRHPVVNEDVQADGLGVGRGLPGHGDGYRRSR